MNKELYRRHLIDVFISVGAVLFVSLLGMFIAMAMGATWQERQWGMLYCVAFLGAMSAFNCMIKLLAISKQLRNKSE